MRRKIDVTASEMRELREQGLSNHDIAKSLDIGKQGCHMERLAAFKDTPPKRNKMEMDDVIAATKYEPKPTEETFDLKCGSVTLSYDKRRVILRPDMSIDESVLHAVKFNPTIKFDDIPDLVQFLAWAMRTRMEASDEGIR